MLFYRFYKVCLAIIFWLHFADSAFAKVCEELWDDQVDGFKLNDYSWSYCKSMAVCSKLPVVLDGENFYDLIGVNSEWAHNVGALDITEQNFGFSMGGNGNPNDRYYSYLRAQSTNRFRNYGLRIVRTLNPK